MGRKELSIDWARVDLMLKAGCSGVEIAEEFGMHPNTFRRRLEEEYNVSFGDYLLSKKAHGDGCLRVAQYQKAVDFNDSGMLLWLGKIRLGQHEPDPVASNKQQPINVYANGKLAIGIDVRTEELPAEDNRSSE